jgi:hypothetical protein
MIIECLLSTLSPEGSVNFAPAGVVMAGKGVSLEIYRGSDTHANLERSGKGVINITDDILAIVKATVSDPQLPVFSTDPPGGFVYENTCRYAFFEINEQKEELYLSYFQGLIISEGRLRECGGFNRARHLLLETAVNVSRIGIKYSVTEVLKSLNAQKNIIIKTGGEKEREAYFFLKEFLEKIDTPGDKGI